MLSAVSNGIKFRNRQVASPQPPTPTSSQKANGEWLKYQLDHLPAAGGKLTIPPATYEGHFVIDKPNVEIQVSDGGNAQLVKNPEGSLEDGATLVLNGENFKGSNLTVINAFDYTMRRSDLPETQVPNPAVYIAKDAELQNCQFYGFQNTVHAGRGAEVIIRGGTIGGCIDIICNLEDSKINLEGTTINFLPNIDQSLGGHIVAPQGRVEMRRCFIRPGDIQPEHQPKYTLGRPLPGRDVAGNPVGTTTGSVRYEDCTMPIWLINRAGGSFDPACSGPDQQGKYENINPHTSSA